MGLRCWLVVLIAGLPAAGMLGAGCSSTAHLEAAHAGRTFAYEPGVPNFDLEVVATLRDGQPGIDLYLGIPCASLVFLPEEGGYEAQYETLVRLLDRRGKTLVAEYDTADTVRVPTYEATQVFEPTLHERRLAIAPGTYVVEVVLTDAESKQQARRRQRVEVVAPGLDRSALSRIRLEGMRPGTGYEPILSLHVPTGLDSLRATVAFYNTSSLAEALVVIRLMRFPSDTTAANPPYAFTSRPAHFRVRYDRADTLQVTRRRLTDLDQELVLEAALPALAKGIYRVEFDVRDAAEASEATAALLNRRRDFAVRSTAFPRIAMLDEMVDALVYIADRKEHDHIRAAETPQEMKRRFDAFWGSLIAERTRAANLLKLYYSRVEEANLRYTTYKEGWKTDRGMIYILFGPPVFVDTQLDREVWRYSYDERALVNAFIFERRRLYASEGMFEAFLLEREPYYEAGWRRALRRWREGEVL